MSSMEDAKLRILSLVPLEQLIGATVELQRRGGRYVGCCPFHDEKTPSFYIYDSHYYCFGCKQKGDAIDFVRHQNGLGFFAAMRYLAERFGIDAPELTQNDQDRQRRQRAAGQYRTMSAAQEHFVSNLGGPHGKLARTYLLERGFSEENINEFGFGFAKDDFQDLVDTLRSKQLSVETMIECSLAGRSQSGRAYDFFRNRLMIPIRDRLGRTIAFGGRTLGDDPAKYINSRETPLFDKSRVLFGIDRAKDYIRRDGHAIVTEGYMDTLQLWQNEAHSTVACLGTALTKHHLQEVASFTRKCVLLFDGDKAGLNASLASINAALEVPEVELRIARLPDNHDPDSFVREHGLNELRRIISSSEHVLDFCIKEQLASHHQLAVPELLRNEFLPWIVKLSDPIQRELVLARLADLTGISLAAIKSEMTNLLPDTRRQGASVQRVRPKVNTRPLAARELELFGHLYFTEPNEQLAPLLKKVLSFIKRLNLSDVWEELADEMGEALATGQTPAKLGKEHWSSGVEPVVIDAFSQWERNRGAYEVANRHTALKNLIKAWELEEMRQQVRQLKGQLNSLDHGDQKELLHEISRINRDIILLEKS